MVTIYLTITTKSKQNVAYYRHNDISIKYDNKRIPVSNVPLTVANESERMWVVEFPSVLELLDGVWVTVVKFNVLLRVCARVQTWRLVKHEVSLLVLDKRQK